MTRHRGASLVELLAVITVGMIVVGLAVTLVRTVIDTNRSAEAHLVRSDAVRRLCESFRGHVRAAGRAAVQGDSSERLELVLDDGHLVEYRFADLTVERTEIEQGVERRRERYVLAADHAVRFEVESDDDTTLVTLRIAAASGGIVSHRELAAVATLGRDRRFVSEDR